MAIELGRERRNALHAEAIDSLRDVGAAVESDDYQRARWLRPRIEAVMRLLDDIGWAPHDPGERFELTMDAAQLLLAIEHLAGRATRGLAPLIEAGEPNSADRERARASARVLMAADELRRQIRPPADSADVNPRLPAVVVVSQTLTRQERGVLFEATWNHIRATALVLPAAVRAGEFDQARRERLRLESEWRIIDAIGWRPDDPREQVELTLPPDLLARALTRLRWAERHGLTEPDDCLRVGALVIDPAARSVQLHGQPIAVTEKEFLLARMLASEPARVFAKDELLREIWGYPKLGSTRTLDSHACRLRQKLRRDGDPFVVNVWGVGYRLCDATPAEA